MAYLASVKLTAAKVAYLPSRYPRIFIFRVTRMAMSSTVHHSSKELKEVGAANCTKTLADLPGPLSLPMIKTADLAASWIPTWETNVTVTSRKY